MLKSTGTGGEGGAATADAKSRCPRAMRMRDDSCHAGVARATDYYRNIEGTYLARALQRGRAGSCEPAEPCACHSGTGESTMFYARHTLPNLTACIHSPLAYSYILCVRMKYSPTYKVVWMVGPRNDQNFFSQLTLTISLSGAGLHVCLVKM